MPDRSVTLGFHPSAKCPLLRCHMACIIMPRVTLSFVLFVSKYVQFQPFEIRRNSTIYLDFARRTQLYVPCRFLRSREILRFATYVYHFTLSGVSQFSKQKLFVLENTLTSFGKILDNPPRRNCWITFQNNSWAPPT